jgi:hypothetical protein
MKGGPVLLVITAGTLFGLCVPFSKAFIGDNDPILIAGPLYARATSFTGTWIGLRRGATHWPETSRRQQERYLLFSGPLRRG